MDSEKSDVELKGGANSCDARNAATEPANCRKCEKPQSGASFWPGILSIVFALVTLGIWLGLRKTAVDVDNVEFLQHLSVISASLCVATGCIALSKKDLAGIAGIVLIILFAFALWCLPK